MKEPLARGVRLQPDWRNPPEGGRHGDSSPASSQVCPAGAQTWRSALH